MKISECLNVHRGLVSMAGGQHLTARLGKYNYAVIKNIRKLESDVVQPFEAARKKVITEFLERYPNLSDMAEADRTAADAELDAQINELLNQEDGFTPHLMDVGVLELCTVGESNAIWALIKEE